MKWKQMICLVLAAFLLAGCSAKDVVANMEAPMESNKGVFDGYYSADTAYGESKPASSAGSVQTQSGVTAQKLIRTMELEVETDNLDDLLAYLDAKVSEMGGYMEEKSVRNGSSSATRRYRYASMKIRVPVARMDDMVEHISGKTNVITSNESADDITLSYVATESRVKALEVEQERLLELLAKADNMSDLLQIEARLTEVRTELEEVASRLRLYDNLVDYGTVTLSVTEVQVFTVVEEETVWQRIGAGLSENWENLCDGATELFVFLVTSLPYLIPLGLAAGVTAIVVTLAMRKTKKTQKDPTEDQPEG